MKKLVIIVFFTILSKIGYNQEIISKIDTTQVYDAVHLTESEAELILSTKNIFRKDTVIFVWYDNKLLKVKSFKHFTDSVQLNMDSIRLKVISDKKDIDSIIGLNSLKKLIVLRKF